MPQLDQLSESRLDGVHISLVRIIRRAAELTRQPFVVEQGLRNAAEEAIHIAQGTSHTMLSKHLLQNDGFGHAADLVPLVQGHSLWSIPAAMQWNFIYPVALAMRLAAGEGTVQLRWGGVWDRTLNLLPADLQGLRNSVSNYCIRHEGPDFLDGPHFEIRSL